MPPEGLGPDEHDDLLAAEYVLGTLPSDERRAALERAQVDGAFAARIRTWELHFEPLNDAYDDAPAPDLLPQIEAQLFGQPAKPSRRSLFGLGWFGGWFGGGLAAAMLAVVAFLAVTFVPFGPAPMVLQAELAAEDAELRFAARWDAAAGQLEITRASGAAAPTGQDYELWLIDESGVPRSLGLLRAQITQVQTPLEAGLTLAVSLEPEGGSPEAEPTGPVLAAAALTEA
jgi:anti-sigma-K factor RskA